MYIRMKRTLLLLAMCLFAIANVAAQARFMDILNKEYAKPERVYQYYVNHQSDSIYALGERLFSQHFTSAQFADMLRELDARLGQPTEAAMWELQRQQGYEIYARQLTYPKHTATLSVVYDNAGSLVGFSITNELARPESNEHDFRLLTAGIELPARLTLPSASAQGSQVPVAILVHGSGPNNMDETMGPNAPFRDLAEGLARRGIAIVRYDKRTLAHPELFTGQDKAYTYDDETADDAIAAVRAVKGQLLPQGNARIDTTRVFVIGHSLGAALAPRIAERENSVAGIVLLAAPTGKLLPTMARQLRYLGMAEDAVEAQLKAVKASLPSAYLAFDESYSPTATAKMLSVPMLVLQGERDYQVTMDDFANWQRAVGGKEGTSLKSYPSLNHLFMSGEGKCLPNEYLKAGHVSEEVMDDIARFINSSK